MIRRRKRRRRQLVLLSDDEIEKMREAGRLAARLLHHLGQMVEPGISTQDLDDEAVRFTTEHGAESAPYGYKNFPRSICTSVNEVVCHGIPTPDRVLEDGDIISVDVTPVLDGFHGDTCATFFVGDVDPKARDLVRVTAECLRAGLRKVEPGNRIGDIGYAIQSHAEAHGYSVVRQFIGHGIGRSFHTAPEVPHFGRQNTGMRLRPGMAFTIEPMINAGKWAVEILDDDWTAVTRDSSLSAQFEHTLVVTEDGVEVMTVLEDMDPFETSPGGVIEFDDAPSD
jgi:methionyl aminopeptidase